MERPGRKVLERLGPAGVRRVLDDLLEQPQLVRLANACGLEYPGMRARSQSRERLLADLATRAEREEAARKAILRVLHKETAQAARQWRALGPDERDRRLGDLETLQSNGQLGLHLFLLAAESAPDEPARAERLERRREELLALAAADAQDAGPAPAPREDSKLRKRVAALDKKVRYLEAQLVKSREGQKTLKQDLIQRKGELAESRMLAERLRSELAEARAAVRVGAAEGGSPRVEKSLEELAAAVRKLASDQKKLAREANRRPEPQPAPAERVSEQIAPLVETLRALAGAVDGLRSEQTKAAEAQTRRLDQMRKELRPGPERRTRARGEPERVGVFVDVQNVYYAARQLKGKLDFDALLEAATAGRRLIQALAYVVESKDTDQSQFIARLQQRAFDVRRKALQVRADGSMKGDWDMELALDILDAAPRLDVVVLVSGDGDFTSLVKRVKAMGPKVEVVAFPRNTAKSLLEAADEFRPLDRKFMIYTRPARPNPRRARPSREAEEAQETAEPAPAAKA